MNTDSKAKPFSHSPSKDSISQESNPQGSNPQDPNSQDPNSQGSNSQGSNSLGAWAETLAATWLSDQGLSLYTANFRRRLGEIDLIFRDEPRSSWVFVEVKFRQPDALVSGAESITAQKRRRLRRTAELFLQRINDSTSSARIDVVTVTPSHAGCPRTAHICIDGHQHDIVQNHQITWIKNAII